MSVLAGGFASILAYGLYTLDGKAGRSGWRWILFVEGLITVGLAVVAYLCKSSNLECKCCAYFVIVIADL
ncbi:hypothetical protein FRC20_000522 [Serendipita sp. 405]|nr:hypothetical protein FRC20_000522 [Serendipita sp. 405]